MIALSAIPKITIVTPSYNQGQFIEETIISVIGQNYPNLEYIIMDGGSTDNTVEIIKKYEEHLYYWVSEKDGGQSEAINKGFKMCSGDILGWLNSDDLYMPGSLSYISENINTDSSALYFGNCIHFKETEKLMSNGSDVVTSQSCKKLTDMDYIVQPSAFWTRKTWNRVGELREDLHYAFDWEWFIRAELSDINLISIAKCLSLYRFHSQHKTATGSVKRQEEILKVYSIYNERNALLYQLLLKEQFQMDSFKSKLLFTLLKKLNKPRTFGDILKRTKPLRYNSFSSELINDLKGMC